jgi:hypothetical protein
MRYRTDRQSWRDNRRLDGVQIQQRSELPLRGQRAAVMPFVAMSVCLLMVTAGISIDLMRAFQTVHQLEFGAQTAALYALSLTTNPGGSYSPTSAQSNIQNAISVAQSNNWNYAQAGPAGSPFTSTSPWNLPVTFSTVAFVPNPLDANEFFLQVTSQRSGIDALQEIFLPLAYVGLTTTSAPPGVQQVSPSSTVEVLGQPATRIGAGAPLNSLPGTRAFDLMRSATLPLAISNVQYAQIAPPAQPNVPYTIDLVASNQTEYTQPPPRGHIKGCLVNDASTGTLGSYYGNGQGNVAINQLEGLLGYFGAKSGQQSIAPAVVEAGSQLNAFDPAFLGARQSEVYGILATLPLLSPQNPQSPQFYILPVLQSDPSFTSQNVVVGFAWVRLQVTYSGVLTITCTLGDSVPVRNASSATGFSSIPGNTTNLMPPATKPFLPRYVEQNSNGVFPRYRGMVLAPAVSPRQLALPIVPTQT